MAFRDMQLCSYLNNTPNVTYGKAHTILSEHVLNAVTAFLITSPHILFSVMSRAINPFTILLVQELSHLH